MKPKTESKEHKQPEHQKHAEKHKTEHKAEPKTEHKAEYKSEHKAEHKDKQKSPEKHGFSADFKHCLHSFRELKSMKAMMVASFDILFYLLVFGLSLAFSYLTTIISKPLASIDPNSLLSSTADQIADARMLMTRVLIILAIAVFVYLLLILLSFVLSRYLIWTTLLNKKLNFRIYLKFALLNAIWIFIVIIIIAISLIPFKVMQSPTMIILYSVIYAVLAIIVTYFTYLMYYMFTEKNLVFYSFKNAFVSGIRQFRKLWFPVILILAVFVVASIVSLPANWMPNIISDIFTFVLLIIVLTWTKIYAASVIERIHMFN